MTTPTRASIVAASIAALTLGARAPSAWSQADPGAAPAPTDPGTTPAVAPAPDPAPPPGPAPADSPAPPPIGIETDSADDFGPMITIEDIEITGNHTTATRVIRRALPVSKGDVVRAGNDALREARFKLLALGFFRDVTLALRKGHQRGHVVLSVDVVERGTIVLNRLWFGSTQASTYWLGADVGERNLFGTGLAVGGGLVYAGDGGIPGQRDQWAGELRIAASTLGGTRWGAFGSISAVHGSEPYRVAGALDDDDDDNFAAFDYRRIGGRIGAGYDLTALMRVTFAYRAEVLDADPPIAPTRTDADGAVVPVDLHVAPGRSRVMTLAVGLDRDTRPDPVLPHDGSRIRAGAELGASILGGSYDYVTMLASYERWWPLRDGAHAIGLRLAGGVIIGDAPRFDRIHLGDVDRMVTPRALGLAVSAAGAPNFLGTKRTDSPYGEVGGTALVEYVARLWRGGKHLYGGDLFVGAGLWSLADRDDFRLRDGPANDALPIDLMFDAGLRVDTEIGIFELTIANALGRVPF